MRLVHRDQAQNVKNRWADSVGETATHWLVVIAYQQGGVGTIVHALPKIEYKPLIDAELRDVLGKAGKVDTVDAVSAFL